MGMIIVKRMSGPSHSPVRAPAVAGRFYPADAAACRAEAQSYLQQAEIPASGKRFIGGIVPHAGWICSGAIAGQTIAAIAGQGGADVVVVFGAIHTPIPIARAALDSHARWLVPGGESDLPLELEAKLTEIPDLFTVDGRLHQHEHAVEVELPLIQVAWPAAAVLPIEVPPVANAVEIGRQTAKRLAESNLKAVFLASSDLTHYGPSYRFSPAGVGARALEWALDNDRRLLQLVTSLAADSIVAESNTRLNACGGGAIAAMLGACLEMGAKEALVLQHTNSYQTLAAVAPQPAENAVGYASVVVF